MSARSWFRWFRSSFHRAGTRPYRAALRRRTRWTRPLLETLEDRNLLSTVMVTTETDSIAGSLRQVIGSAAAGDTITFAAGVKSITLTGGELFINKDLT